ncbi:SURF1 family protein [Pseudomonas sp. MYb185]|uniref:SURF1 family protein n=1 Tax=Pseudomonas sp. MYb185 TaxID=1848729 RepID=UPI000CFAAD9C|nr:SURF1 family protein [Pseudomonas sp. MYb185]PRB82875.1 cytochrome oxidase biogenesis protein Surf1,facilitates heme A insertion [Pseudomonas sp. MYb185]
MTSELTEPMPRLHRFAPGWPLWVFTLALLPVLLGLGVWQLDRAEQKRQLQAQIDRHQQMPAVPLTAVDPGADLAWQPLLLTGRLDTRHIWLLDNRTRDGQAGVEVLQVFHDSASDQQLLINRGWLPWPDRRRLPAVPTPQGNMQLQVEVLPEATGGFTLASPESSSWPKLVATIDLPAFAEQAGIALQPWMARLTPGSQGALRLDWPPLPMSASKHTGYAVQWFALAAALLILFIWAGLRPDTGGNNEHDEHD